LESLLGTPKRLGAGDWQRLGIGIPAATCASALTLRLIRASDVKFGEVNDPSIPTDILGDAVRVRLELVSLEVHLRLEDHKLLLQAFLVKTQEMIFLEVAL
jgi:hypothetical protein